MKVIKMDIVVDRLPSGCKNCIFADGEYLECSLLQEPCYEEYGDGCGGGSRLKSNRLPSCPLRTNNK